MKKQNRNKSIILTTSLCVISFGVAFVLSFTIVSEFLSYFLRKFLDLLFSTGVCVGHNCGSICCGNDLLYVAYFVLIAPLFGFFLYKKMIKYAVASAFFFLGSILGVFMYTLISSQ